MNWAAVPVGGGKWIKFRKPLSPITRKIKPARYRAIVEAILITLYSPIRSATLLAAKNIDVNIMDVVYFREIQVFLWPRAFKERTGPGW
jgi:hypothetical protein